MMMRAGDPAIPESSPADSLVVQETHDRMIAAMPAGSILTYENRMAATKLTFEVLSHGPLRLHAEIRLKQVDIGADPTPATPLPSSPMIPQHSPHPKVKCEYLAAGECYWCCPACDTNSHRCPGCGTDLDHNGKESNGESHGDCT